jgi:hypothetical protein
MTRKEWVVPLALLLVGGASGIEALRPLHEAEPGLLAGGTATQCRAADPSYFSAATL